MRLINADEIQYAKDWVVTDKIPKVGGYNAKAIYRVAKEEIDALPTVDAVPVVHGRWIRKDYWSQGAGMGERYGYYYSCSKCGNLVLGGYDECGKKYCDECGARMDGKGGDHAQDKKS